ncbi:MAG: hypothetical protein AAF430_24100 [Myxococcota bacterium]
MGAALLALAGLRFHTADEPLERDLTLYAVMGHELLLGEVLYAGVWDHKPPAIYAVYAWAEALVGFGPSSVLLLNLLGNALVLAGLVRCAQEWGGVRAAAVAAVVWGVVSGEIALQANQPNAELFMNAGLVWTFALFLRPPALDGKAAVRLGMLVAFTSLFKMVTVAFAVIVGLGWWLLAVGEERSARFRFLVQGAAAAAGAWGFVALGFVLAGAGTDFWDAVVVYNRSYSGGLGTNFWASLTPTHVWPYGAGALVPLFVALFFAIGALWTAGGEAAAKALLLALYALSAQLMVALPGQWFPHYYQLWLPVLALGVAWSAAWCFARFEGVGHLAAPLVVTALLAWPAVRYVDGLQTPPDDWSRAKYGDLFVASRDAGEFLAGVLGPNERFQNWGNESGLYFYARRRPASGLAFIYPLLEGPLRAPLDQRLASDLEARDPALLVLTRGREMSFFNNKASYGWFEARDFVELTGPRPAFFRYYVQRESPLYDRFGAAMREQAKR